METCPTCGKKLGIFKIGSVYKLDEKRFCSIKCKKDYISKNVISGDTKKREKRKKWINAILIILGIFLIIGGCQQLIGKSSKEVNKEINNQEITNQEVTKIYKEIARFEGSGTKSTESFKINSDKVKIVAKIGGSIVGSVAYISLGSEDDKYFSLLNTFTVTATGEEGAEGESIIRNLKQGYYYIDIKTGVGWEAIVYEYS